LGRGDQGTVCVDRTLERVRYVNLIQDPLWVLNQVQKTRTFKNKEKDHE